MSANLQRFTDERDVRNRRQGFERYGAGRRYHPWYVRPKLGSTTRQLFMTTGRYVVNVLGTKASSFTYSVGTLTSSDFAFPTSGARALVLNVQQTNWYTGGPLATLTVTSAANIELAISTGCDFPEGSGHTEITSISDTSQYRYVRIPIAAWDSDGNIEQIVNSLVIVTVNTFQGVGSVIADVTGFTDGMAARLPS